MEENQNLEERIIDTARTLFMERGFDNTSMSDIASATGINRTALHYYFRTKEKMFQAVFGSIMLTLLPRIQLIFDEDIPLPEKFSKVVDEYFRIFRDNPALPRFILGEINRDVGHLLDTGRRLGLDKYLLSIGHVVMREMDEGRIREVSLPMILITFMSQVTFPFLTHNLMMSLFYDDEREFTVFLEGWKTNIIRQMQALLT